jgi:cytochrome c
MQGLLGLTSSGVALLLVLLAGCGGAIDNPVAGGDAERGEVLLFSFGCGACHIIPGVVGADGTIGPPLDGFGQRAYIAGRLPNRPENLLRWIQDPEGVEPGTAMPTLPVGDDEARHMAAYLYTLQ